MVELQTLEPLPDECVIIKDAYYPIDSPLTAEAVANALETGHGIVFKRKLTLDQLKEMFPD